MFIARLEYSAVTTISKTRLPEYLFIVHYLSHIQTEEMLTNTKRMRRQHATLLEFRGWHKENGNKITQE